MECLDDNAVSEFVSGTLARSAATKVEGHLAGCRDCRALVAAMAQDVALDSNVATVPHEKLSPSQVAELPRKTWKIGDKVGRYLILSTLGTGGMGVVFSAYDPQLDRKVALKLLRSGLQLATKDAQKRLRREAQAIAQLSHPNVVGVYDVGATDDGDLYIAMEFVEGDTLTTWLKKWPRTWREIVDVFLQAGKGLVAAHGVGLLHRDFKPDNVLVGGDGRVRVTDFGLARSLLALDEESGRGPTPNMPTALNAALTATGTVLGTPRYMPPEQLTGPDIDARADQFSYCVALHEALYGEHPLPGSTSVAMLENNERALPPRADTKVPASIGRAVGRGLERDPKKRYPTMATLMAELVPPAPRFSLKFAAAALGAVAIAGIATAAVISQQRDPPIPATDSETSKVLIDKINELKTALAQRDKVLAKLNAILDNPGGDPERMVEQLTELRRGLKEREDKIQILIAQIEEFKNPSTQLGTPKKVPPSRSSLVVRALADIELDNCFSEWAQRVDDKGNPHREANMLVKMTVNADGVGHSAVAIGESSPSLRICIESALTRTRYPKGSEVLDVEVTIGWNEDLLNRSSRIVGHREAPRLDLE